MSRFYCTQIALLHARSWSVGFKLGLGGVPFATQFTYGEMGPSGFAAEEGEARVEDEQCNLMLNLLVFGREPQAE